MKSPPSQTIAARNPSSHRGTNFFTAGLLLAIFPAAGQPQAANPLPPSQPTPAQSLPAPNAPAGQTAPPSGPPDKGAKPATPPSGGDRRRAVKLFLEASKLFEKEQFEEAMRRFQQAAMLDPSNADYSLAADVARSHAVTALIQAAARDRLRSDASAERAALEQALALDPRNIQVTEHLHELGDDALRGQSSPLYEQSASTAGESVALAPLPACKASTSTPTRVRQSSRSSRPTGSKPPSTTASTLRRSAWTWMTPASSRPCVW